MDNGQGAEELCDGLDRLQLQTATPGLISSPTLTLAELTLYADSDKLEPYRQHVILHFSQRFCGTEPSMEAVDVSLLIDKLPASTRALNFDNFFLIKFWANLNFDSDQYPRFLLSTYLDANFEMKLTMKTEICVFGQTILESVDEGCTIQSTDQHRAPYQYASRTPLCSYVEEFIRKLMRDCPNSEAMNGVLENFSAVQVITNQETKEVLLSIAFVFEVCSAELSTTNGAMCSAYRLTSK